MPKANFTTKTGLIIEVSGTIEEINSIINYAENTISPTAGNNPAKPKNLKKTTKRSNTPTALTRDLISEGFFRPPKSLPEIQAKLEELGHYYSQTALSPTVLRLVKSRELRRIKEKKGWVYTA